MFAVALVTRGAYNIPWFRAPQPEASATHVDETGITRGTSHFENQTVIMCTYGGTTRWILFARSRLTIVVAAALFIVSNTSVAQSQTPPQGQPRFEETKEAVGWATDLVVWPIHVVRVVLDVITQDSAIAILISAASAAVFAVFATLRQAEVARLRQTFITINRDNWDKDVIAASQYLAAIKDELRDQPGLIAEYCQVSLEQALNAKNRINKDAIPPGLTPELVFRQRRQALLSILADYEGLALAIRYDVLDEKFLHGYRRSNVISDWAVLAPLVNALRTERNNPGLYVQFQGLADAWSHEQSYGKRKSLGPRGPLSRLIFKNDR